MSIHGIDVSEFQGSINWADVKGSGTQFVMIRAGYGQGNLDPEFRRNAEECNRQGIPFGVYWFSYAYTEDMARKEADYCIQAIEDYEVQYPVCFDFEGASVNYASGQGVTVTRQLATSLVTAFCSRVEQLGFFAMYYSNLDFLNRMFDASLREKYALWYAQYASAPSIRGMAIWQYSDAGRISGISGNVDQNIAYYDLANVISRAGLNKMNREVTTPVPPAASPTDVIIYTVRPGDNLSSIAARYGTSYETLASYNNIENPNLIFPGQEIRIPVGYQETSARYYTIKPGDTLSGIALRFGTTVAELQRLNGISNPNLIYAGTTIRV
ncbi:LysM peptidoglycan-binding domain-containing protein [Extibacter muris]|uniref:LysM peptidoglycan-binding domain-containing protein n=1 Tax=Extibacter muris TaxID=1796622 RepID=UPI001D0773A5|nr:LysM peptidoglycan-binding domain-containing protein [Extibacter muris]MCB6203288.1 LysM peptidoglycan-binding domain-containing protein [Extibacter muris]MCQ4664884.1 LysM peptidoglycan-binding domain-containing protein [Extibacter muris]MCQ4694804.1 LysM peptidoglycan-binding domain-containing protein [Extibacter muris]